MSWLPTVPRKVAYGAVLLALTVLVGLGLRSAPASANGEAGALAIETRLLAPCCWNGTLDTHDSELARTLRSEIETRVAHGASACAAANVGRPPSISTTWRGAPGAGRGRVPLHARPEMAP